MSAGNPTGNQMNIPPENIYDKKNEDIKNKLDNLKKKINQSNLTNKQYFIEKLNKIDDHISKNIDKNIREYLECLENYKDALKIIKRLYDKLQSEV